jgi:hypothetical protein
MSDRFLDEIERLGYRPRTCPWRAFEDDAVTDILKADRWAKKGGLAQFVGADPPNWLVDGLDLYWRGVSMAEADRTKRERAAREAKRVHGTKGKGKWQTTSRSG